jgi:hypothetical protein
MKKLCALALIVLLVPELSFAKNYVTDCGGTRFEVSVEHGEHPLDNVYTLFASLAGQDKAKLVHRSNLGGWFFAECVRSKAGTPLLVFQEFCGGSACVEDRYGVVDPKYRPASVGACRA